MEGGPEGPAGPVAVDLLVELQGRVQGQAVAVVEEAADDGQVGAQEGAAGVGL